MATRTQHSNICLIEATVNCFKCKNNSRTIFLIKSSLGCFATQTCPCQEQDLNNIDATYWDAHRLATALPHFTQPLDETMKKKFSNIKHARIPAAWEKIFESTPQDDAVQRCAIATAKAVPERYTTIRNKKFTRHPQQELTAYDDSPCSLCSCPMDLHRKNKCTICRAYCGGTRT